MSLPDNSCTFPTNHFKLMATRALREAVSEVSPFRCVQQVLWVLPDALQISLPSSPAPVPLNPSSKVVVIAFGKASLSMTAAAEKSLGERFLKGAVLAPFGSSNPYNLRSRVFYGAKDNLPEEASLQGTSELLTLVEECDLPRNVILFLISGGGSALFCSPEGVTLEEKLSTIHTLVSHGASIQQLNVVRQGLSRVKGGRTLEQIKHARVISLIMSDIIGDPVDLIASGPTVPLSCPTTPLDVLSSLRIPLHSLPPPVAAQLRQNRCQNRSYPEESHFVVANNDLALRSLKRSLEGEGYCAHIATSALSGDATIRGRQFAELISSGQDGLATKLEQIVPGHQLDLSSKKLALIFGGETTVEGAGKGRGRGGRSQHMVLQCLGQLAKNPGIRPVNFCFLAAGTDGQDGPTPAAGAVITGEDLPSANTSEIQVFLDNLDSYNYWVNFKAGSCHIVTGPTGTNVMDVQICLVEF